VMNVIISDSICTEPQPVTALFASILSWGLIFLPFVLLIIKNPGWLTPFANTFGHIVALFHGLTATLDKIFIHDESVKGTDDFKKAISRITSDRIILVNEVTPENFDNFVKTMSASFNIADNKIEFKKLVGLKYAVAKFVWYILIGILSTSMSYNYLLKSSCNINKSSEKRNKIKKYDDDLKAEQL